ncbi:MAG TPA: PilN domain-containing protein [Candidatus Acidoferrales bacterium]|nr:PilN domain-containing protein [Candidatus Acidoferrales bacterium]
MIRINLLGQARPKAARRPVPLEATLQIMLLVLALVAAVGFLFIHYYQMNREISDLQAKIRTKQAEKARLENLKQQVENFDRQKAVLQQRIAVIEELQRNRTGGQELLDMVATTVTRTDELWLTSLSRKGNTLTFEGTAASINAVANFITQLKRSGYFQKVEIKESHQDDKNTAVQTFLFTLNAEFALPQGRPMTPSAPSAVRKG